jgi:hypothetical protein
VAVGLRLAGHGGDFNLNSFLEKLLTAEIAEKRGAENAEKR